MEKADCQRETHDFMNVQSFSQLPFIRPAPPPATTREKNGIRLFGKEFCAEFESAETFANVNEGEKDTDSVGESSRKFECHYCCRNFPTSQALGGHQNAHKRERQHAKRAHLQTVMAHSSLSDAHTYGHMDYHRFMGSAPMAYPVPAWNSGSHGSSHQQEPINGSPLGFWRVPTVQSLVPTSFNRNRSFASLPSFAAAGTSGEHGRLMSGSNPQSRYAYESNSSVQDQVSLDLRL